MNNPNDLLLFLDVAETGSFQGAATLNYIDRSAVSRRIGQLEANLGTRLLQRSTRSQSLTAAGQEIVRKAQELRQLLLEMENIASAHHEHPQGLLRINAASNFGQEIVFPVAEKFIKDYPELELELLLEDRWIDVTGEGFDLTLRIGNLPDSNLIARQLATHPLKLVASPNFIKLHGYPKNMAELSHLRAVSYKKSNDKNNNFKIDRFEYLDQEGQTQVQMMSVKFWLNRIDLIIEAILADAGYSVMPQFMTQSLLDKQELIELLPEFKLLDYAPIYALYPHRNPPLKTKLFLNALEEHLRQFCPSSVFEAEA